MDWHIRHFVYRMFASRGKPPSPAEIAEQFALSLPAAQRALRRLHGAHALFLRPGAHDILMANPMSAVPTDYQVTVGNVRLYANCAWDALGIPAMLRADAQIQARHPLDRALIHYSIERGQLRAAAGSLVHFAIPFRDWYLNLVDT